MSTPHGVQQVQGALTGSAQTLSVVVANFADVALQLSGTFSGTVQFETTVDNQTWVSLSLTPSGGGSAVTSATATGIWEGNCGGYYAVRARCSAFSSGPIYVSIAAAVSTVAAVAVVAGDGLTGTGTLTDPLDVQVDGVTIDLNASNQLEVVGGLVAPIDASYLTSDDETSVLTGSRQLIAGDNITLDATTPGQLSIAASGGGGNPFAFIQAGTAPYASTGTIRLGGDSSIVFRDPYLSDSFDVTAVSNTLVAGAERLTFGAPDDFVDTLIAGNPAIPNNQELQFVTADGMSTIRGLTLSTSDVLTIGPSHALLNLDDTSQSVEIASTSLSLNAATSVEQPITFNDALILSGSRAVLSGSEIVAPSAPSADGFKLFAQDNGAGKTQLCVLFSSGAVQVLATQP